MFETILGNVTLSVKVSDKKYGITNMMSPTSKYWNVIIAVLILFFDKLNAFPVVLSSKVSCKRMLPTIPHMRVDKHRRNSHLKAQTFDDFLATMEVPVLVDFYATWCGPCQMMQPVLEEVAGRLENVAKVAKVDTDKSPKLGGKYQVEALPTFILFSNGKEIDRFLGYMNADELESKIRQNIARLKSAEN